MNIEKLLPKAEKAEAFLKALANKHRLLVLCELHQGECSVGALMDKVGLSQSALSQHLAKLREDGLVVTRRDAQTIYYALANDNASRVIAVLYDLFCADKPSRLPSTRIKSKGAAK
ncbi:MAG: putative HTH-type transcriptional regulator YgaV [Hyphomicrobiales bacterium]|jgi:DNA-binding transcriptional ArsR family regulator|nr:putative HTH-type transcriptional regulator YgaV [Hyphomicrobiales bacterium]